MLLRWFCVNGDREVLERRIRSATVSASAAKRARIVLLAADGAANSRIAELTDVATNTVCPGRAAAKNVTFGARGDALVDQIAGRAEPPPTPKHHDHSGRQTIDAHPQMPTKVQQRMLPLGYFSDACSSATPGSPPQTKTAPTRSTP